MIGKALSSAVPLPFGLFPPTDWWGTTNTIAHLVATTLRSPRLGTVAELTLSLEGGHFRYRRQGLRQSLSGVPVVRRRRGVRSSPGPRRSATTPWPGASSASVNPRTPVAEFCRWALPLM
jgi:hypothetical protein